MKDKQHFEKYAILISFGTESKKRVYARSNKWPDIQRLRALAVRLGYTDAEIIEDGKVVIK